MAGYCITRNLFSSVLKTPRVFVFRNELPFRVQVSTSSLKSKPPSILLLTVAGVGAGAILGGGYSFYSINKGNSPISNDGVGATSSVIQNFPGVSVSRRVFNEADASGLHLTLFQYPTCPFCCKVRAFLNFYGISYDVVEVDPVLRQQIGWSNYKKVPILLAKVENGYQQLNDSSMIISALASYLQESQPNLSEIVKCYPSMSYRDDNGDEKSEIMNRYFLMLHGQFTGQTKEEMEEERKWRKWADNTLVHTLSPNVYRTKEEALQAFEWFSEVGEWDRLFPSWERNLIVYAGAYAMLFIGKRLKKRHNLKDNVRLSLYDECNNWMRNLKKKNATFLGGKQPNLGDLAVYGVLSSIEGCIAFEDLLKNTSIGSWYWPMKKLVQSNMGIVIS
ncbi:prostaglandin E synthase 2-like [Macrosteles quadrilineatus]|uniref:prostaglandin E synthase 2-like n=1 Tax=Macrosteles quadrilineatus TaxID=74068 RepID=UPI0023E260BD|nr:prostaglandin E synthase 2-like [Macrosteles quadrilineatus]